MTLTSGYDIIYEMGIQRITNDIEREITYGENVNPYNTNISADLEEITPEKLAELKKRKEKITPVLIKRERKPTKGILNQN